MTQVLDFIDTIKMFPEDSVNCHDERIDIMYMDDRGDDRTLRLSKNFYSNLHIGSRGLTVDITTESGGLTLTVFFTDVIDYVVEAAPSKKHVGVQVDNVIYLKRWGAS